MRYVLILSLFVSLTACQQAVKGFVEGGGSSSGNSSETIGSTSSSSNVIKISHGSAYAKGTQVEAQVSITNRALRMTGGQVSARVGISQNRVE